MANIMWISILLLKIILSILIIILAVVLVLILLICFVPIKYSVNSEYFNSIESLSISAKVKWLGKLLYIEVSYKEGVYNQMLRFLGKDLAKMLQKEEIKGEDGIYKDLEESSDTAEVIESLKEIEGVKDDIKQTLGKKANKKSLIKAIKTYKSKLKKLYKSIKKLKWNFNRICDMIKRVWRLKEKIEIIFERPVHKRTLDNLKRQGMYLWGKVKPKKILLKGDIGFEDPSLTGKSMAILGILFPFIGEYDIEIEPHFEDQIIELTFSMSGRLYVRHILKALFKLVSDKRNRHTFKTIKRLKL